MKSALAALGLEQYTSKFEELGYDSIDLLQGLDKSSLGNLCDAVGLKPGHKLKLMKYHSKTMSMLKSMPQQDVAMPCDVRVEPELDHSRIDTSKARPLEPTGLVHGDSLSSSDDHLIMIRIGAVVSPEYDTAHERGWTKTNMKITVPRYYDVLCCCAPQDFRNLEDLLGVCLEWGLQEMSTGVLQFAFKVSKLGLQQEKTVPVEADANESLMVGDILLAVNRVPLIPWPWPGSSRNQAVVHKLNLRGGEMSVSVDVCRWARLSSTGALLGIPLEWGGSLGLRVAVVSYKELKKGDTLHSVNGIELRGPEYAMESSVVRQTQTLQENILCFRRERQEVQMEMSAAADNVIVSTTSPDESIKLHLSLTESINVDDKTFVWAPPSCEETCDMIICPWSLSEKYVANDESQLEYVNACICCCQPWEAYMNGTQLGSTRAPTCCENGFMLFCCPCCVCSGEAVLQYFSGPDKVEKYTIRRDLFPCWTCVDICACFGRCYAQCKDCYHYSLDVNYLTIEEELRGVGNNAPTKGIVRTVDRLECAACCGCVPCGMHRVPMRYSIELLDRKAASTADLQYLGLLPVLYRGARVPWRCCAAESVPRLTGVDCLDAGRHRKCEYATMKNMMKACGAPEAEGMER